MREYRSLPGNLVALRLNIVYACKLYNTWIMISS